MSFPTRFVARPSVAKLLGFFIVSVAFVIGGAWIAGLSGPVPKPGREWVGWAAMLFFGIAAIVILLRVFDRNDQIVIDSRGLYWKLWSSDVIPWSQITDVRESAIRRQRFLCIYLKDPGRYPSGTLLGRLGSTNKALGYGDIAINAMGTDKSFDELKSAALAYWSGGRP
jgi:hypothetical protein